MALVVSAMFVACDTTQGGTGGISDKDKENATRLVELYEASYSHLFVEGVTNDYWMSFFTTELDEEEGYPKGSCEFVSVEFFPICPSFKPSVWCCAVCVWEMRRICMIMPTVRM